MPNSTLHTNKPLTNISVKYRNTKYIGDEAFPKVNVKKDTDLYYVHNSSFQIPETLRANGTPANQITWGVSTSTYALQEHALKDILTDRDKANYDIPIDAEGSRVETLTDGLMLRKEQEAAAILFTTTSFSNSTTYTATATQTWKTSTVNPVADIISATSVIRKASVQEANLMVLGTEAYDAFRENTNVTERIKYVERAIVTADIIGALTDIDKVLVGKAIYDTNKEGLSESTDYIWGANCFVGYVAPNPGLRTPSAVYRFEKRSRTATKWRDEDRSGDWLQVSEMYDHKAVATGAGYLIKSVSL